jgi:hypothetical protein
VRLQFDIAVVFYFVCRNLIDVAQEPAILDEKDVEDRLERYNQFLKFDPVSVKKSLEELFALPGLPDPVVEELSEKDNAFVRLFEGFFSYGLV